MRILITGGGTGGHVAPAVAVILALRARAQAEGWPLDLLYLGSAAGVERQRMAELGVSYGVVQTGKARAAAPADRYPDVAALAADVERFLAGEPVTAVPERAVDRAARFARKHRAAIVLISAYLLLRALIAWLAP